MEAITNGYSESEVAGESLQGEDTRGRDEEAILGVAGDPAVHYRAVILREKLRLNLQ